MEVSLQHVFRPSRKGVPRSSDALGRRVRCFRLQQLVDLFTLMTAVEGLLLLVPPGLHGVVGMMFMHMRSMLLYVICLLHVYVCYMSLALELDMLFVVICCMSVICYMLLFVVICYMSVICYMPVICLVLGGVVRVRLYVIYCAFV